MLARLFGPHFSPLRESSYARSTSITHFSCRFDGHELGGHPAAVDGSRAESVSNAPIPTEVLQWQRDLKRLSADLQRELDEKMEAVAALSEAYESASARLRGLIQNAEAIQELSGEARRRSA